MEDDAKVRWADARKRMCSKIEALLEQELGVQKPERYQYSEWILDRIVMPEYMGVFKNEWTVWRQDDIGNQFIVESGLSYERAQSLVLEFEKKGHKQFYWCRPKAT